MSCRGCVTLNDRNRKGVEPLESLEAMMAEWSQVLDPKWILIFGGEPMMHPHFKDVVRAVRKHWPNCNISIPTNALLLKDAADSAWLDEIKPVEFRISYHRKDLAESWFKESIRNFMKVYPSWKPNLEESLHPDVNTNPFLYNQQRDGVSLAVCQYDKFIVPYRTDDHDNIHPYNNIPEEAFEKCVSQENVYLYKNQLWKCLPYPNLKDTVSDFDQRWPHYQPYSFQDDLTTYFNNVSCAESICSMCPNSHDLETRHTVSHGTAETVKILPSKHWISKNILNVGK